MRCVVIGDILPSAAGGVVVFPPPIPNCLNKSTFGLAPTRDVTRRVKLARVSVKILGVHTRVKLICPLRLRPISPVPLKPLLSRAPGKGATLAFLVFPQLREPNILFFSLSR